MAQKGGWYKLTDRAVSAAQGEKDGRKRKLNDGGGLSLIVRDRERKYWTLRVAVDGSTREVGLGSAAGAYAVSLADARDAAFNIRKLLGEGLPLSEAVRRATKRGALRIAGSVHPSASGQSFKAVAEAYMKQHEPSWKSAIHARQWWSTLETYAYPVIGHKAPGDITTADVIAILKQELKDDDGKPTGTLWNTMPDTASRLRGRIEKIIAAWKVESGQQDKFNPATWKGHLEAVFPRKSKVRRVEHHPAMPYAEVPAFMTRLAKQPGMAAQALGFLVLTATRTSETLAARWPEIDLDKRRWAIPAERMKVGKAHVVPLSDAAIAVLDAAAKHRIDGNDAVFPGTTWVDDHHAILSNMAMLALLRRMKVEVTAHGFRSSFRDWCADTGKDRELAEACLAHSIGAVEGSYRRSDMIERRSVLMAQWGQYVTTPSKDDGDKVVAIRKAPARARG
jgi:integrase